MRAALKKYLKKRIVVDTQSSWVYIGCLESVMDHCLLLSSVDAHDGSDSTTSKEQYIMDSRIGGVRSNRESVYVNLEYVIGFSPLEDVVQF